MFTFATPLRLESRFDGGGTAFDAADNHPGGPVSFPTKGCLSGFDFLLTIDSGKAPHLFVSVDTLGGEGFGNTLTFKVAAATSLRKPRSEDM